MNTAAPTESTPLTAAEIHRLDAFLIALPAGAMNVEQIDGFFSSLHCAPETIGPSVWLWMIWGTDADQGGAFADEAEAHEIAGLLMRHWSVVGDELTRALDQNGVRSLLLTKNEAPGATLGNHWAQGFARGMAVSPDAWCDLLEDEERGGALGPMFALLHEHDRDPAMRPPPITPQERGLLLADLAAGLSMVYRDLAGARRVADQLERQALTFRRTAAKVGRNDPCPCGSGRKFKVCCARTSTH